MRGFFPTARVSSPCNYRLWAAQAATQHQPQGGPPPPSSGTASRFKYWAAMVWGGYYLYADRHQRCSRSVSKELAALGLRRRVVSRQCNFCRGQCPRPSCRSASLQLSRNKPRTDCSNRLLWIFSRGRLLDGKCHRWQVRFTIILSRRVEQGAGDHLFSLCRRRCTERKLGVRLHNLSKPHHEHHEMASGAAKQLPCAAGTYSASAGGSVCTSCPIGSYSVYTASAGSFTSISGVAASSAATAVTACPAGTFSPSAGSTACTPCPINTYTKTTGNTVCSNVDVGMVTGVTSGATNHYNSPTQYPTTSPNMDAQSSQVSATLALLVVFAAGAFVLAAYYSVRYVLNSFNVIFSYASPETSVANMSAEKPSAGV